jgi:hypothetical protein
MKVFILYLTMSVIVSHHGVLHEMDLFSDEQRSDRNEFVIEATNAPRDRRER